jgi:lysozyme
MADVMLEKTVHYPGSRVFSAALHADAPAEEVTGVDVSVYQGEIDWAILAGKAQFAVIRAGYGNEYIDPRLDANVVGAASNGVPYGIYWYLKPGKDWKKHAERFAQAYNDYGGAIHPTFDLEETGGLNKTELESWCLKCFNRFGEVTGLAPDGVMCYTSAGFLNPAMGLTNWLKWRHLWVAHWTTAPAPIIPNEWAVPNKPWKFWQYSAKGIGADYGVQSKSVDLDRYNGTRAQFAAEFDVATPPPPPPAGTYKVRVNEGMTYLNYRDAPDGADLGDLYPKTVITIDSASGDWLHFGGGWVHKGYVTKL